MFANVIAAAGRVGSRALLYGKKYLPEILTYSGVAGFIGSVIMSCKATTKSEEILAEQDEKLAKNEECLERTDGKFESYTEEDKKKDDRIIRNRTRWKLAKTWIPAITLLIVSVFLVLAGHHILHVRSAGYAAAYKATETAYRTYRKAVREKYGEEADLELVSGKASKTLSEGLEEGASLDVTQAGKDVSEANIPSPYAVWFDQYTSRYWKPSPEANHAFLVSTLRELNDRLYAKGYLFLNEVYEALGMKFGPDNIPYKSFGQYVGWVRTKDGSTDNQVDFGLWDRSNRSAAALLACKSNRVFLDFNVDGVIYDLI